MGFFDTDRWNEIWQTISRNRKRRIMTALGGFWGIFMLTVLLGAGMGLGRLFRAQLGDMSTNTLLIQPSQTSLPYKGMPKNRWWWMNNEDVETVKRLPEVQYASAVLWGREVHASHREHKGDYTLMVGVPRGSRIIGVGANTVNPSREAGASMSTDGAGDMSLILDIPRGSRIAGVTARTLATGEDATVTATRDAAGDTTLAFGLPRGAKGDKGDPGDAGQIATATVAGVVKPGDNLSVRADGTLDAAAARYELPVASDTTLGGVKVSKVDYTDARTFPVVVCDGEKLGLSFKLGDNAMPDGIEFHGTANGTLALKKATQDALGIVRGGGKGIHVAADGTLNLDLPAATAGAIGGVKPDGTTITADTDGTISAFTATASTLMGEGGATMGDALEVAPGIWLCIIRQWVITTQGGYYDAFSFSVYDRAGSRIALAASPTAGTHLILPVAGNARTKEYNYDTLMGKWVCTTTNTSDTAKPDPCTLLLRARA